MLSRMYALVATLILALLLAPSTVRADLPTLDALRPFPGPALVPPDGLRPFADVPLVSAGFSPGTATDEAAYSARWDDGMGFDKVSSISGTVGRRVFGEALSYAAECLPRPDYCPIPPKGDFPGEPIGETFLSLQVRGAPALVTRLACCNGGGWRAVWYDAEADVSYELWLPLSAAYPHNRPSPERGYLSSPDNILGAQEVVRIADQLVVLR